MSIVKQCLYLNRADLTFILHLPAQLDPIWPMCLRVKISTCILKAGICFAPHTSVRVCIYNNVSV